jgi:hypothetical protein
MSVVSDTSTPGRRWCSMSSSQSQKNSENKGVSASETELVRPRTFSNSEPKQGVIVDSYQYEKSAAFYLRHWGGNLLAIAKNWIPFTTPAFVTVPVGSSGLRFRAGRYIETLAPGSYFCNPCSETIKVIDVTGLTRTPFTLESVRTADAHELDLECSITVAVASALNFVLRFQLFTNAQIMEYVAAEARVVVRELVSMFTADEILSAGHKFSEAAKCNLADRLMAYGLSVQSVSIVDVDLSDTDANRCPTKAQRERQNRDLLLKAKGDVDAEMAKLAQYEKEFKSLGPEGFDILLKTRLLTLCPGSAKIIMIPGSGNVGHAAVGSSVTSMIAATETATATTSAGSKK